MAKKYKPIYVRTSGFRIGMPIRLSKTPKKVGNAEELAGQAISD